MSLKLFFVFLLLLASFVILLPFIKYILFSIVLYFIALPIYKKLLKYLKFKSVASALSIVFILLSFVVPIVMILYGVFAEFASNINIIKQAYLSLPKNYESYIKPIIPEIYKFLYKVVESIPNQLIGIMMACFITYYLLIESENVYKYVYPLILKIDAIHLIDRTKNIIYGSLFGNVLFWIIQAFLSYIAFVALSVPFPLTLSLLVFIFACLPILGPWTVWVPIIVWFYIQSNIAYALFSFFYGIIFITVLSEILIKPVLVSKFTEIHSVIVLLGIFGGLYSLGFVGIFIGPLILELTLRHVTTVMEEKVSLKTVKVE